MLHLDIVDIMENGAKKDIIPHDKINSIHEAAKVGKLSSILYHLSTGTDINVKSDLIQMYRIMELLYMLQLIMVI